MMQQKNRVDDTCGSGVVQAGSCMVHDKQTCLLLVKIIEICGGRIGEASSMINNMDGAWFIQLGSSICDNLQHKLLLSQVALYAQIVFFSSLVNYVIHGSWCFPI
jgi:ent-copalyl diphosphate synthase